MISSNDLLCEFPSFTVVWIMLNLPCVGKLYLACYGENTNLLDYFYFPCCVYCRLITDSALAAFTSFLAQAPQSPETLRDICYIFEQCCIFTCPYNIKSHFQIPVFPCAASGSIPHQLQFHLPHLSSIVNASN